MPVDVFCNCTGDPTQTVSGALKPAVWALVNNGKAIIIARNLKTCISRQRDKSKSILQICSNKAGLHITLSFYGCSPSPLFFLYIVIWQESLILPHNQPQSTQNHCMANWENIARGLLGMIFLIAVCYLLSNNRKAVNWKLVGIGVFAQVMFAMGVLHTQVAGQPVFWLCFGALILLFIINR